MFKLKARGGSMWPFLRDGDVVWVRETALGDLRIGDVVCYADAGDRLFLHRLVGREGDTLVTRGDTLTYVDRVEAPAYIGRAVAFERRGRQVRLDTTWQRRLSRAIVRLAPIFAKPLSLAVIVRRIWRNVRHA
jgi:signal peptidase I